MTSNPDRPTPLFAKRLRLAIEGKTNPWLLAQSGVSTELLGYAGITISDLIVPKGATDKRSAHYHLEHAIDAFQFSWDDLLFLSLQLGHFAQPERFPIIVLYDMCGFRAQQLFGFIMSHQEFLNIVVSHQPLVLPLLRINEPFWKSALTQTQ